MKRTTHCRRPLPPPPLLVLLVLSVISALLRSSASESGGQGDDGACNSDNLEELQRCLEQERKDDRGCHARSVENWDQVLDLDIPVDGQKRQQIVVHPNLLSSPSPSPKTAATPGPSPPWEARQRQEKDAGGRMSQTFENMNAALKAHGADSRNFEQIGAHQFG